MAETAKQGFHRTARRATNPQEQRAISAAVTAAKHGDNDALRILYLRYADSVYGYVLGIVRDHHEAEDVTQQVFAKLLVAIGRFDDRGTPFLAWLLRLARNQALDDLRHRRPILVEDPPEQAARVEDSDHADSLRDALAELPAEQREVVMLRHIGGFSPAEIASRTGRSESAVHGLHHRGRQALRAGLARRDAVPHVAMRHAA
jgi:RNA polymerase sigma-70 factor (ECF subfamily)